MKALVYHGPGQRAWEDVPGPDDRGADGRDRPHRLVDDLRDRPAHPQGRRARGRSPARSSATRPSAPSSRPAARVTTLEPGDRVLVSCITSCGRCRFCKEGRYGLCTGGGGWIFGHLIDGLQAEYARVPFADTSVYKVPDELTDEQVLFLADILPTAYEVGVLNGGVEPGDTVAIVGAGPIGLATIMTAKLYTPGRIVAIDLADVAAREGASSSAPTSTINNGAEDAVARIMELTGRPRRRRRDRGGRRARDVRALHRADPAGRPRRERRRPRPSARRSTSRRSGSAT